MKSIKKSIYNAKALETKTESRETGEMLVFTQSFEMESSQPGELNGLIKIATGKVKRSRKFTTLAKNVDLESLDLAKTYIVQVISNRPIGISASAGSFKRQVDFQKMEIDGEAVTDENGNQLYHIFALSTDNYDISLRYEPDEKTAELEKANSILGIANVDSDAVLDKASEEANETF